MPTTNQKLLNLEIKKLKCIKDLSISFAEKNVTVILGPNGNGKSTILHALACCFEPISADLTNYKFSDFFLPHSHALWQGSDFSINHEFRNGPNLHNNQFQHYSKNSDRWAPKYARRPKRDILYIGIDTCVPMIESEKSKVRLNYSTSQVTEEIISTILKKASFVLNRQYSSVTLNEGPQGRKFIGVVADGIEYTALSMSAGEQKVFHIIEKIFKAPKSTLILIDEIDLLLHDLAVSRLIKVIVERAESKNLQIVFTTHRESIIEHSESLNIRHIINKGSKTLCFKDSKPDAINRLTGKRIRPIEIYVEDDLSQVIIQKIGSSLGMQRYISVKKFGAAINCFTIVAGLLLDGENCENSLFVLDGDVYKTEEDKKERINSVLTGNDPEAIANRASALDKVYQYNLPQAVKPERHIHSLISSIDEHENSEFNEIIEVAKSIVAEDDDHKYVNEIINQIGWDPIIGLSKVIDLFCTTEGWDPFVRDIQNWLSDKAEQVMENA